jgi:hypothetical protein
MFMPWEKYGTSALRDKAHRASKSSVQDKQKEALDGLWIPELKDSGKLLTPLGKLLPLCPGSSDFT